MRISRLTVKAITFHRDETMRVHLSDGRAITVPLAWYPRLKAGKQSARRKWELCAAGQGIHWPELNEDVSIEGLLAGAPSPEYRKSRTPKSVAQELRIS